MLLTDSIVFLCGRVRRQGQVETPKSPSEVHFVPYARISDYSCARIAGRARQLSTKHLLQAHLHPATPISAHARKSHPLAPLRQKKSEYIVYGKRSRSNTTRYDVRAALRLAWPFTAAMRSVAQLSKRYFSTLRMSKCFTPTTAHLTETVLQAIILDLETAYFDSCCLFVLRSISLKGSDPGRPVVNFYSDGIRPHLKPVVLGTST